MSLTTPQSQIISTLQSLFPSPQFSPITETYLQTFQQSPMQLQYSQQQFPLDIIDDTDSLTQQQKDLQIKLLGYKKESNLVLAIDRLLSEYEINFKHLAEQRVILLDTLQSIHKDTSELIRKQRKYIDLSNAVKQNLDYYLFMDKFEFNFSHEPNSRQIFEDQLQPTLSMLTDAIQFFTENTNYANGKKYLSNLQNAKLKVTSFVKSYLIKLLIKEQYGFSIKNSKVQINKYIDNFYPKSKSLFLVQFLTCFPQFTKIMKNIINAGKESEGNELQKKQAEIEDFILNDHTLSLITYLQNSIPQVYEQVVLKSISYYRTSFHQNLYKTIQPTSNALSQNFYQSFRQTFIKSIYLITCQSAYLWYCFRPTTNLASTYAQGTLIKISEFYSGLLVKMAKQPSKNKDPFQICNLVTEIIEQCDGFIKNYSSKAYESYVLGNIFYLVQNFGIEIIRNIFMKICNKIKHELQPVCINMLPKFKQVQDRNKFTEQILSFIKVIPNLKYCQNQAEKYLIECLDTLIKSVKEISARIQSRFECYAWNIEIFSLLFEHVEEMNYSLVKKQMKIDIGETTRMIQKVQQVERSSSILKYASELFSVIKTGVPSLSQLTLDFNTFIKDYYEQLKQKFVKDMVFIHSKNIIQFLHNLKEVSKEEAVQMCDMNTIQNLQSGYKLSIQNFVNQANQIISLREKQFPINQRGEQILICLLEEVEESLLELLGSFYVEVSKYQKQTEKFESIMEMRSKFEMSRNKRKLQSKPK